MAGIFDPNTDPLGIGLRQRAGDRQSAYYNENPAARMAHANIFSDPRWDAYFQSLDEAGVSKLADQSVGEAKGMFPASAPAASTYDPSYQTSAVDTMPSNQFNVPGEGAPTGVYGSSIPAMDALSRATGGFTAKETPQYGRGRRFMKVQTQRGTSGSNQSERG
jgi:hypothetical protein